MPDASDQYLLGQIHGIVQSLKDGQDAMSERLDSLDARLRAVEQRAALTGAVSGGVISVGVTLLIETMRGWMRGGGTGS